MIAYWTVNEERVGVRDDTPGHTLETLNGDIILKVTEMQYSRDKNYTCTAEYSDGEVVRSDPFILPNVES